MKLLTKGLQDSYENAEICYVCKEKFENKYVKDKVILYSVPKKAPAAFHNGSFYHKEFTEELEKQLSCLGEKIKKYITFTVPIEKEVKSIDENIEEVPKNISYRLQFNNSKRFKASSLSNLVKNFSEGIHEVKCKYRHNDKK